MDLKQFYEVTGGDYNLVMSRLSMESLVKKFLLKFLDDETFGKLTEAVLAKDFEQAFKEVHTIKGVALNLELASLAASCSELTELLRGVEGKEGDTEFNEAVSAVYEKVKADYDAAISNIKLLD